jgi:PKD repeat protein
MCLREPCSATSARGRQVVYNGANHPPAAGISVDQTSGAAPLMVASDGSGANDLDAGDVLGYAWDLGGDGQVDDSTARRPTHTYAVPGTVTARLRVADPVDASDTESVAVTVGAANCPPVPVIDTRTRSLRGKGGRRHIVLGPRHRRSRRLVPPSQLSWSVVLNHCPSNCHTHIVQTFTGAATGTFPAPDYEYPSSLSLVLSATDLSGASAGTSPRLDPRRGPDDRHDSERTATVRRGPDGHGADDENSDLGSSNSETRRPSALRCTRSRSGPTVVRAHTTTLLPRPRRPTRLRARSPGVPSPEACICLPWAPVDGCTAGCSSTERGSSGVSSTPCR